MDCPFCDSSDTEVYNSRLSGKYRIWRRRRCRVCHESFTTYEQMDLSFLSITDGKHYLEPYQRHLLYGSIYFSLPDNRNLNEAADALTDTIETRLLELRKQQISKGEITEIALATLKAYSLKGYLKYLSDHSDIDSIESLRQKI